MLVRALGLQLTSCFWTASLIRFYLGERESPFLYEKCTAQASSSTLSCSRTQTIFVAQLDAARRRIKELEDENKEQQTESARLEQTSVGRQEQLGRVARVAATQEVKDWLCRTEKQVSTGTQT